IGVVFLLSDVEIEDPQPLLAPDPFQVGYQRPPPLRQLHTRRCGRRSVHRQPAVHLRTTRLPLGPPLSVLQLADLGPGHPGPALHRGLRAAPAVGELVVELRAYPGQSQDGGPCRVLQILAVTVDLGVGESRELAHSAPRQPPVGTAGTPGRLAARTPAGYGVAAGRGRVRLPRPPGERRAGLAHASGSVALSYGPTA